jgi:predicted O-methyltransferase YrrM
MSQEQWSAVDQYITDLFVGSDPVLDAALEASKVTGQPQIHVSPSQGKLLSLLARIQEARTILEIGTLAAYSTIWMGRALPPSGLLVTLEADPKHAEVAHANLVRAGLSDVVDLRLGPALETLPALAAEGRGPFDFIFIDADKESYPEYLEWSLKLSRRGTLIVADNVIQDGAVIDPVAPSARVQGVRRFMELLAADPRVSATALQTVGSKGYDGFAFAVVTADL